MQSLRDRNKAKNTKTRIATGVVVLIVLLLLSSIIFPGLGKGFRTIFTPFWRLEKNSADNIGGFFASFKTKRALIAENEALKNKILEQSAAAIEHQALLDENTSLKEMLGRKQSGSYVLATILVKPGRSLYDTVVIDAGSEEGIRPEALVYAYQTVPVGTVTAVSAHSATVTLFTTSGQKTNGRIEGKNIDVELVGRGGGNFELKVPRDVTLMPDMTVLLPGLRTSVVAVVAKSITDARDPVQTFLLTSPVNINELNSVEVAR